MQSSLLKGKRFAGEVAHLGRSNGSKTHALFGSKKSGTKQLKKAAPPKTGSQASKAINKFVSKNKPKGSGKKVPVAPGAGRRSQKGGKFQGITHRNTTSA